MKLIHRIPALQEKKTRGRGGEKVEKCVKQSEADETLQILRFTIKKLIQMQRQPPRTCIAGHAVGLGE